jgi:hypothetical protein
MKKTNGGTRTEAAAAMAGLEEAFILVQNVAKRAEKPDFEPSPAQASEPPLMSTAQNTPAQPPPVKVTEAVLSTPPPAPVNQTPPPAPPAYVENKSIPVTSVSNKQNVTPPTPPKPPAPPAYKEQPGPGNLPGVTENLAQDENVWAQTAGQTVDQVISPTPKAPDNEPQLGGAPLQDIPTYGYSKPSRSVELPSIGQAETSPSKSRWKRSTPAGKEDIAAEAVEKRKIMPTHSGIADDLMTPDITVGLSQLLSEWKIFKGSGLFGMGPGGIDHPLYIAIKDSTMLSIMNGTFTGATDEIQQSINDYINGWRYEQSIIPQHSETFEHFLRRVVRKVLKDAKR